MYVLKNNFGFFVKISCQSSKKKSYSLFYALVGRLKTSVSTDFSFLLPYKNHFSLELFQNQSIAEIHRIFENMTCQDISRLIFFNRVLKDFRRNYHSSSLLFLIQLQHSLEIKIQQFCFFTHFLPNLGENYLFSKITSKSF